MPWSPRYQHVVFARPAPLPRAHVAPLPARPEVSGAGGDVFSDESTQFIRAVLQQAGLSLLSYRLEALQRRVPACLRFLRVASPGEARRKLRSSPNLLPGAVSALLLGVTSFFRDETVFGMLADKVLPQLSRERPFLRFWSIGCSDGAEVLSLAILLAEAGLAARSYLLGVDVRHDAIAAARSGEVPALALRNVPPQYRARYFASAGGKWTVRWGALPAIGWCAHNPLTLKSGGVWDMILCRNMAMYLRPEAGHALWTMIARSLRPGGIVVTGRAERPAVPGAFAAIGPCIFQRTKGSV